MLQLSLIWQKLFCRQPSLNCSFVRVKHLGCGRLQPPRDLAGRVPSSGRAVRQQRALVTAAATPAISTPMDVVSAPDSDPLHDIFRTTSRLHMPSRCYPCSAVCQRHHQYVCIMQAVIGAGAAGLVAVKELRREGHRVTVFEQSDDIGGVWRCVDASTACATQSGITSADMHQTPVQWQTHCKAAHKLRRELARSCCLVSLH
jgi:NAD(P)-binding Rossmann-like domain